MRGFTQFKLYSYFRSSASYRVRIALHYKEVDYEYLPVHLVKNGGEQHSPCYRELNPLGKVPCLVDGNKILTQSMAIIQYLDSQFPERPLFPTGSYEKARVIEVCEIINSGIQPLQNLGVLQKLDKDHCVDSKEWTRYWIKKVFIALDKVLEKTAGTYSFGGQVTAADCFIIPQVYNAHRFKVDMSEFPHISRVNENSLKLESFQKAKPSAQLDANECK